jgi:hypothetical protein
MEAYLDLARRGRNEWWRYLVAVFLILVMWQLVGAMPTLAYYLSLQLDGDPATSISAAGQVGGSALLAFITFMLASVFFLVGLWLGVVHIHNRPLLTLVTSSNRLAWRRIGQGFVVWLMLSALICLLEAWLYPGRYVFEPDLPSFLAFLPFALVLIPIQTSAEELFFRGYLLQGFGLRLRSTWALCLLSGLIFGIPHLLNPEASADYWLMGSYYVLIGAVLAFVTLREGRLELALGLHAANNLFSALFANYQVSVLPSPSLFTIRTLDPLFALVSAVAGLALFLLIFLGPLGRTPAPELKT